LQFCRILNIIGPVQSSVRARKGEKPGPDQTFKHYLSAFRPQSTTYPLPYMGQALIRLTTALGSSNDILRPPRDLRLTSDRFACAALTASMRLCHALWLTSHHEASEMSSDLGALSLNLLRLLITSYTKSASVQQTFDKSRILRTSVLLRTSAPSFHFVAPSVRHCSEPIPT
jgi:hypothetical protein